MCFQRMLVYVNGSKPGWGHLLSFVCGLLTPFGFAPFSLRFIPIITISVLLLLITSGSKKQAFVRGFVFGIGMFGFGVSWIFNSMYDFGSASILLAFILVVCMVLVNAVIIAAMTCLYRRFSTVSHTVQLLLIAPALWVMIEWLRTWLLTGFPWLFIAYAQVETCLGAYAPLGGMYLVSFVAVTISGALALLIIGDRSQQKISASVIIILLLFSLVLSNVQWTQPVGEPLSVAMVQGAVPQELRLEPENLPLSQQQYEEMSEPHLDKDLIIWPETAIPTFAYWVEPYLVRTELRLKEHGAQLLTGIFIRGDGYRQYYNSLIGLGGDERQTYHKRRLVPFGEYMPFRWLLEFLRRYIDIPMSDISVGKSVPQMSLAGYSAAVGICYESAYPEIYREQLPEAAFMVNVSNDAWFGDSLAPHQHLEIAQIRALEAGRPMLRATNTGISAFIDHKGRVQARTQQFQPEVLEVVLQPYQGVTWYVRFGSMPVLWMSMGILLMGLLAVRRHAADRQAEVLR